MTAAKPMTVAAFRAELAGLSYAFVELRSCLRVEQQREALIVSRRLREVLGLECKRAKPHDLAHRDSLVEAVRAWLAERPELLAWLNENA